MSSNYRSKFKKNNYHSCADGKITTLGVKNLNLLQELIIKNYC
jgi:hypothetical protein